jgi:hypothetical protein
MRECLGGDRPVSLLLVKSMVKRVLICERVLGMFLLMLVLLMVRYRSLVSLEMEGGIGPTRLGVQQMSAMIFPSA